MHQKTLSRILLPDSLMFSKKLSIQTNNEKVDVIKYFFLCEKKVHS
jgi:hypothetical protein